MSCVTAPSPGSVETTENHGPSQTSSIALGVTPSPSSLESTSHIAAPSTASISATLDHSNISLESQSQFLTLAPGVGGGGGLESVTGMTSPAPGNLETIGAFSGQSQLPTVPGLDLANFTSVPSLFPTSQSSMMPVQPPPPVAPVHPHVSVMPPPSFAHISPQAPTLAGYGDVAFLNSAGFHPGGLQSFGQYAVPTTLHPGAAQAYGMSFGQFAQPVASTGVAVASNERPAANNSICKHFMVGRCNYGTSCKFSHATDAPGAGVSPLGIYSGPGSLICKHWLSGRCTYPDCKFKHEGTPGAGYAVPAFTAPAVAPTFGFSALAPPLGTIRSSPY